jgi:hypothetical protein
LIQKALYIYNFTPNNLSICRAKQIKSVKREIV